MKRLFVGTLALAIAGASMAAGPGAIRKQVEASMLLTGNVVVGTDGSVVSYTLDEPGNIPPEVTSLIADGTRQWHFRPVLFDGKPVNAKARMSIRVVAKRADPDNGTYVARISAATFGDNDEGSTSQITYAERHSPAYPVAAVRARVEGTVYVILRVNHEGHVVDAAAEQVNLEVVASENDMRAWRRVLADPSVRVAKTWTFHPPTEGPHANDPYYVVRVPIQYHLNQIGGQPLHSGRTYGEWSAYVPGPKEPVSWNAESRDAGNGVDALPDGELSLVGTGLTLITPLGRG